MTTAQSGTKSLVSWSDSFSLGLPEIDEQHKALLDLINQVWASVIGKNDQEETLRIIGELEQYTLTHFAAEETFMRSTNYSQFAAHKEAHDNFVARVAQEKANVVAGKRLSLDIVHFLKDWLINHILAADMSYAEEYKKKAIEPASGLGKFFKRLFG